MTKRYNLYLGKAGHFHVMAEFLCRGWNVAIPEVDVGDDIFVVRDADGEFARVQVKTSTGTARQNGFSAKFSLSIEQLKQEFRPELTYVFLARWNGKWSRLLLISRQKLLEHFKLNQIGTAYKDNLTLYFSFQSNQVLCSETDFTAYLDNFSNFPLIEH